MYSRQRTSLRNRGRRNRTTLKQRGGADWYYLPGGLGRRREDWTPPLTALGLAGVLARTGTRDSNPGETMEDYFKLIEAQDEVFDAAAALIAVKSGLPSPYSADDIAPRADAIDAQRAAMMEYIKDVEKLLVFTPDAVVSADLGATKLQKIYGDPAETLTTLLLFPKRLNNMFVDSVANLLITLKQDDSVVRQSAMNAAMLHAAVIQYNTYVVGTTLLNTSLVPRDGFFLNQGEDEFRADIETERFWETLLTEINRVKDFTVEQVFVMKEEGCVRDIREASWAVITAHIFLAYKLDAIGNILALFTEPCATTALPVGDRRPHMPNPVYDAAPVRGTTYGTLLSLMEDTQLQYILHLTYVIKKNELLLAPVPFPPPPPLPLQASG